MRFITRRDESLYKLIKKNLLSDLYQSYIAEDLHISGNGNLNKKNFHLLNIFAFIVNDGWLVLQK